MSLLQHVNPLQGTDSLYSFSNGNTLPLISMPWGMAAWSPQTNEAGKGWYFNPHHNHLEGIRLTHQPSPWIGDYGHFTLLPQTGSLKLKATERTSSFRKQDVIIRPDYYRVELLRYQTILELTPTSRCACMRLTFEEQKQSRLILSPFPGQSHMQIDPENGALYGYVSSNAGGTPEHFRMYFYMKFDCSISIEESGLFDQSFQPVQDLSLTGERVGAYVGLVVPSSGIAHVQISTSYISAQQAKITMEREIGQRTFEEVRHLSEQTWESQLSVITIEDDENSVELKEKLDTFYTCLYRTSLFPHACHEYDEEGRQIHYSPYNGRIEKGPLFTDIGFWDTYRTSFPLYNLLYPSFMNEVMEGWVNAYKESAWMPKWASPGERGAMPGTLIDASFADAVAKNIHSFDVEKAFEGLYKHAMTQAEHSNFGRKGLNDYLKFGYLPADTDVHESVSSTLDYVYGDFCIAQIAKHLGREEEYHLLMERAQGYRSLYDASTGFMRARTKDGKWQEPFDPFLWGHGYCEGGPWQSSWAVQHDFLGLADAAGGRLALKQKLDALFASPPHFKVGSYGFEIHEMSEMAAVDFGQFAISNQPSFHIPYIYTAIGYPALTQYWVRKTMDELFSADPTGLPGDEDNGSLTAWYVFGAMGLYPLTPGVPQYVLGSPLFNKMTVHHESGKQLVIEAKNQGKDSFYVDRVEMNGKPYESLYVDHKAMMDGGILSFMMTDTPSQVQYEEEDLLPFSMSRHWKMS